MSPSHPSRRPSTVGAAAAALLLQAAVLAACGDARPPGSEEAPAAAAPAPASPAADLALLESRIRQALDTAGLEVGLVYRSLGPGGDSLLLSPDLRMHAASTMKVPVMMRLVLDHQEEILSLDDRLPVTRTFRSIVDGSPFDLPPASDSDTAFYARVGGEASILEMMDRMITWSSNLATNLLIQVAEPERVNALLRALGADSMEVLRGVEDLKAFEAGLSNTTTARDLAIVMRAVAESPLFTNASREIMLDILRRQHFQENIGAGLPPQVPVASKSGWITGINHDAAVVFPPDAPPYVLVILMRGPTARDAGPPLAAHLSRLVWEHHRRGG